jgi:sulfate transporter 4
VSNLIKCTVANYSAVVLISNIMTTSEEKIDRSNGVTDGTTHSPGQGDSERERLVFQSIHRRNLNHIATDGIQSKRHSVPEVGSERKPFRTIARELMTEHMRPRSRDEWIGTFIPCYTWLRTYDWRAILLTDILAGIAVGVMAVPQSLSYAKLADLPVEYGLYSVLFPIMAYSVFGSSRQLSVGPVALVSLILGTGLNNQMAAMGISKDDPNYYDVRTTLAIQTSLLVGILNIVMGLIRLGFVTIFMSHAVISGFISGASIVIGMSQLKGILGVQAEGDNVQRILASIFASIGSFNYKTFLMGMSSLATLILFKQASKKYPKQKWLRAIGPLFVTAVTILVTWGFNLSANGIPVVKYIPAGFPAVTIDRWVPIKDFGTLMPTALSITIIGFIESIAIVKSLAAKHKYEVDASTELIGLGVANFVGAMFQAFPVTGSFGRSAVNDQSGAQSGVSGMVTALLVGMVLLFLTDVFEYMVSWFSCWFPCGFVSDLVRLRLPAFVSPLRHCHSWCT